MIGKYLGAKKYHTFIDNFASLGSNSVSLVVRFVELKEEPTHLMMRRRRKEGQYGDFRA